MSTSLEKGADFIWKNGRHLERAIFEYHFQHGSPDRILKILGTYQNDDGGFGHALEPDLRAPDSQPLFVEFALRSLYESNLRAPDMAARACDFLARHSDMTHGIPVIFPSSQRYPRASHWDHPAALQPSFERLAGLVGLACWQGVDHLWLETTSEACLAYIAANRFTDSHTILNAFCLVDCLSHEEEVESLFTRLTNDLFQSHFFNLAVPTQSYGLTPLDFAPSPASYCRSIFTDDQIEAHLEELASRQEADGGWPIQWNPPSEAARWEWRAQKTLSALSVLRSYGRI